ncbi:MAG: ATP-binding protein [Planctomycetota bacterium]
MLKQTIFSKIFGGTVLVILTLAGLILLLAHQSIRRESIEALTAGLEQTCGALTPPAAGLMADADRAGMQDFARRTGQAIHARLTVIDANGTVLADSVEDPAAMGDHSCRPEILQAQAGATGSAVRFSRTVHKDMLYVAVPVRDARGGTLGTLRLALPVKDIEGFTGRLWYDLLFAALVVTGLALFGSLLITRSIARPIQAVAEAARRVADGDFDVQVHYAQQGELGRLAGDFNHMTSRIKALMSANTLQKAESNSIIAAIQEGLLVIDRDGVVTMSNASCRRFVNADPAGKHYWEVLRVPELEAFIRETTAAGTTRTTEFESAGRWILASAAHIPANRETVLLLHDITTLREFDTLKKDFVANVSHELRTPLTAIKGFVETLAEEAGPEQQKYIEIVRRHTDRLVNIVRDLLVLSQMEDRYARIEKEPVRIDAVARAVTDMFAPSARDKGLTLVLDAVPDLPEIQADPFKLEQVLINLVENAIRYTERGGVTLALRPEGADKVRITVRDTGIGIPAEFRERIFERFFVVDKSRSKKMGGTGLGLAIVKHAVLLHGGTITVDAPPEGGTVFTVVLPVE